MKRTGIVIIAMIGVAAFVHAQSRSSDANQAGVLSQPRTVVGCYSQNGNIDVITGGAPGPKQFRIVGGDTSGLLGKAGHTLKVTGMVGKNDPMANITEPYNQGTTTGVGWNTILAQRIEDVYSNCSGPGEEYSAQKSASRD